jgi:hypothetical protein
MRCRRRLKIFLRNLRSRGHDLMTLFDRETYPPVSIFEKIHKRDSAAVSAIMKRAAEIFGQQRSTESEAQTAYTERRLSQLKRQTFWKGFRSVFDFASKEPFSPKRYYPMRGPAFNYVTQARMGNAMRAAIGEYLQTTKHEIVLSLEEKEALAAVPLPHQPWDINQTYPAAKPPVP